MKIKFVDKRLLDKQLEPIYSKVINKTRLSKEDGISLFETFDLTGLGRMADVVRRRLNFNKAYYVYNQHLNYTNICSNSCSV